MTKLILFDFFGVLCAETYWGWLRKVVPNLEEKRELFHGLSEIADRGDMSLAEIFQWIGEKTGFTPEEVSQGMKDQILINKELLELITILKVEYKIGLLSNASYEWLEHILSGQNLYPYFDEVIISSRIGLIKPEPKIFEYALNKFNVLPNEALFIDDRLVNVEAAQKGGLRAVVFENVDSLKVHLKELGLIY